MRFDIKFLKIIIQIINKFSGGITSLSPTFKKWVLISSIAGLNLAFFADGIHAQKEMSLSSDFKDHASHSYITKSMDPVLRVSTAVAGLIGGLTAISVYTLSGMVSLPGIYAGEYLGKALYQQPRP